LVVHDLLDSRIQRCRQDFFSGWGWIFFVHDLIKSYTKTSTGWKAGWIGIFSTKP
jgi:hypothetical protein